MLQTTFGISDVCWRVKRKYTLCYKYCCCWLCFPRLATYYFSFVVSKTTLNLFVHSMTQHNYHKRVLASCLMNCKRSSTSYLGLQLIPSWSFHKTTPLQKVLPNRCKRYETWKSLHYCLNVKVKPIPTLNIKSFTDQLKENSLLWEAACVIWTNLTTLCRSISFTWAPNGSNLTHIT